MRAPVLLIPGTLCDERLWQPVAGLLEAAGHPVQHAPTLSQGSIGEMAHAVAAAIGVRSAVVGFSQGAIVAVELARRCPERVAALGLIAFNASSDLPERAAARPVQQAAARQGRLETLVADELKPNYLAAANRANPELRALVMDMARRLGPETFIAQSEALRLRDDLRPVLPSLDMPVFYASGCEDRLCPPEWHRRWAEMTGPQARAVEIAGAGHLLPLEQPDRLATALLAWLEEVATCPTGS